MEVDRSAGGAGTSGPTLQAGQTSADYYFDSYSHFGIHEEMLKVCCEERPLIVLSMTQKPWSTA